MCNVGKIDKIVRIVLGLALLGWGAATASWWGAVGIIPLGTALLNFCPLYALLKIDTGCKVKTDEEAPKE